MSSLWLGKRPGVLRPSFAGAGSASPLLPPSEWFSALVTVIRVCCVTHHRGPVEPTGLHAAPPAALPGAEQGRSSEHGLARSHGRSVKRRLWTPGSPRPRHFFLTTRRAERRGVVQRGLVLARKERHAPQSLGRDRTSQVAETVL